MAHVRPQNGMNALTAVTGLAGVLFGIIVGYVIGAGTPAVGNAAPAPVAAAAQSGSTPVANEAELQAYRNILASDPKNAKAAIELGNRLYDAGRYAEAVQYYRQAFANDPRNINVSTDLATALWYLGRADEALAQFDKSLAIDAKHAQTLFNIGVVRSDGKNDPAGAIKSWETLLAANPSYPDAVKVRSMIDAAKQRLGGAAGGTATH